jgi:transposase
MRSHRKYDPDFKREAVRLVIEDGMGIREVERSLGITYGVLKGWMQKQRDHQGDSLRGRSCTRVARSRTEASPKRERSQRQRDILKKCSGYLIDGPESIFGFITEHRSMYGVKEMCRVFGVPEPLLCSTHSNMWEQAVARRSASSCFNQGVLVRQRENLWCGPYLSGSTRGRLERRS